MTDVTSYPQPSITDTSRPLVEAWRRGELALQRCADCAETIVVPRELCPRCWSTKLCWSTRSGKGRIVTAAQVYSHVTPPFADETPVIFAEIELDEGGIMLARVIAADASSACSGCAVTLVTMPEASRYPLPTFRVLAA